MRFSNVFGWKAIVCMLFVCCSNTLINAQSNCDSSVQIYVEDDMTILEHQFSVPVRVNNFDSIEGLQLSLNFDPSMLDYDKIDSLHPAFSPDVFFFGLQETHIGIIRLAMFDPFQNYSLPDSAILFRIYFTAIGKPGDLSPVNIADYPLDIYAIVNEEEVDVCTQNAFIDIQSDTSFHMIKSSCVTGVQDTSGSIQITAYGGNPPYLLLFANELDANYSGGRSIDTFGSTVELEELVPGRYILTLTDEDNRRIETSINVRSANELLFYSESIVPTCPSIFDGYMRIDSITGWINPLRLKWSDGELFQNERFEMQEGIYTVSITDPLGCQVVDTFNIEANGLRANIETVELSCLGDENASLNIELINGVLLADSNYRFVNGTDTTATTTFSLGALPAGNYNFSAFDSIGCVVKMAVEIEDGLSFEIDQVVIDDVDCHGDSSGQINMHTKILTGMSSTPLKFEWPTDSVSSTSNNSTASYLSAGTYSLTVSDTSGNCAMDTSFMIIENTSIELTSVIREVASCNPGMDGSIAIEVMGGVVDSTGYLFSWSDNSDSSLISGISSGTYAVTISDKLACTIDTSLFLDQQAGVKIVSMSSSNFRCNQIAEGEVFALLSSPIALTQMTWSNGDTGLEADSLLPGIITFFISDINGCRDSSTLDVPEPMAPQINQLNVTNIKCHDEDNGLISAEVSAGALANFDLKWNTGDSTLTIDSLVSGAYRVIISDANFCADTASSTLINPDLLTLDILIDKDSAALDLGKITALVTGGLAPYQYIWSNDVTLVDSINSGLEAGEYVLTLRDQNGCIIQDSIHLSDLVAINTLDGQSNLQIYPNPTSNILHIEKRLNNGTNFEKLMMLNASGKRVFDKEMDLTKNKIELNLGHYPNGVYYLILQLDNGLFETMSILKQ